MDVSVHLKVGEQLSAEDRARALDVAKSTCLTLWGEKWDGAARSRARVRIFTPLIEKTVNARIAQQRACGDIISLKIVRSWLRKAHEEEFPDKPKPRYDRATIYRFLHRNGWSRRRTTSKMPINQVGHDEAISQIRVDFITRVAGVVGRFRIPAPLIVNFDQTGLVFFNASSYTWTKKGEKRVLAASANTEKAAVTAVLGTTADNKIIPPQLVFKGTTDRSLPKSEEVENLKKHGWRLALSKNHWSNAETMEAYVKEILVPWLDKRRQEIHARRDQRGLVILDCWTVHRSAEFIALLKEVGFEVVFIPAGMTGTLQPQDVSFNRPVKASLAHSFDEWYCQFTDEQKNANGRLAVLKPLLMQWLDKALRHAEEKAEGTIAAGWRKSGLLTAITDTKMQTDCLNILWHRKDVPVLPSIGLRDAGQTCLSVYQTTKDRCGGEWTEEELVDEGNIKNIVVNVPQKKHEELDNVTADDMENLVVSLEQATLASSSSGAGSAAQALATGADAMDVDGTTNMNADVEMDEDDEFHDGDEEDADGEPDDHDEELEII